MSQQAETKQVKKIVSFTVQTTVTAESIEQIHEFMGAFKAGLKLELDGHVFERISGAQMNEWVRGFKLIDPPAVAAATELKAVPSASEKIAEMFGDIRANQQAQAAEMKKESHDDFGHAEPADDAPVAQDAIVEHEDNVKPVQPEVHESHKPMTDGPQEQTAEIDHKQN